MSAEELCKITVTRTWQWLKKNRGQKGAKIGLLPAAQRTGAKRTCCPAREGRSMMTTEKGKQRNAVYATGVEKVQHFQSCGRDGAGKASQCCENQRCKVNWRAKWAGEGAKYQRKAQTSCNNKRWTAIFREYLRRLQAEFRCSTGFSLSRLSYNICSWKLKFIAFWIRYLHIIIWSLCSFLLPGFWFLPPNSRLNLYFLSVLFLYLNLMLLLSHSIFQLSWCLLRDGTSAGSGGSNVS